MIRAETLVADFELSLARIRWKFEASLDAASLGARGFAWRWALDEPLHRPAPADRPIHAHRRDLLVRPPSLRPPKASRRPRRRRLGTALVALPVLGLVAACTFPYYAPDSLTDSYLAQHRATQAIEISDSRSRWLGVMPRAMMTGREAEPNEPAYLATDVEVPGGWADCLIALEDENVRSWRSLHGIDLVSIARAFVGLSGGTDGGGGSTLTMQLVRSMNGINPSEGTFVEKLQRKFVEVRDGAVLYHRLGGVDAPAFRQYLARHIPLVIGAQGSEMGTPIHGIGMASEVLWGVPPQDLNLAQQAILAAAVWRPVILAPDNSAGGLAARDGRWRIVVRRAILGLELAYPGDARAREAIAMLRTMPPPRPSLGALEPRGLDPARRFQIAANPERRAMTFAGAQIIAANGEMLNHSGRNYLSQVTGLRLSVDSREYVGFRARVQAELDQIERALDGRLGVALRDRDGRAAGADIVIAVVHDGRIVRFFSNSREPVFNGSFAERDADGRFRLERAVRPVGSVAKAMLAVLFGRTDEPVTLYCNQRVAGGAIHNSDGSTGADCAAAGAWLPARQVFGRSLNLPLIWRSRVFRDEQLRAMAQRYRLSLPAQGRPGVSLPLGLAAGRPADLTGMMQAIARGALGQSAVAPEPKIVTGYRMAGDRRWHLVPQAADAFDFRRDFTPRVAAFVRSVLSAPVEEHGTLAGLARVQPQALLHIGKSGTTDALEPGHVRDKYAVGAFRLLSGDYSYVVLVSARNPRSGLGANLSWRAFYPLLRLTLTDLPSPP